MKKSQLYFIFVFALPILAVLWWWGLFSNATISAEMRGDYTFAYLDAKDVYSKLDKKRDEVRFYLKQQKLSPEVQLTLILTDPRITPHADLRAKTGYLVPADYKPTGPLKVMHIAKRNVVVASIKAHPLFSYGKTYKALIAQVQSQNKALQMPTLEVVKDSVLSVEMPADSQAVSASLGTPR